MDESEAQGKERGPKTKPYVSGQFIDAITTQVNHFNSAMLKRKIRDTKTS
jgi:hypothetical protein